MTNKQRFLKLVDNNSKSNWLEEAKFRQANKEQLDINLKFAIKLFKYFDALKRFGYIIQDLVKDTYYAEEKIDSIRRAKLHEVDMDKFLLDITLILNRLFKESLDKRLSELSNVKDSWYEGYGKSIPKKLLSNFEELLLKYYDVSNPFPAIFPTVERGLLLEWTSKDSSKSYMLEINNGLDKSDWLAISNFTNIDIEATPLDLTLQKSWEFINTKINTIDNGKSFKQSKGI